jgi:hypothetical protein
MAIRYCPPCATADSRLWLVSCWCAHIFVQVIIRCGPVRTYAHISPTMTETLRCLPQLRHIATKPLVRQDDIDNIHVFTNHCLQLICRSTEDKEWSWCKAILRSRNLAINLHISSYCSSKYPALYLHPLPRQNVSIFHNQTADGIRQYSRTVPTPSRLTCPRLVFAPPHLQTSNTRSAATPIATSKSTSKAIRLQN